MEITVRGQHFEVPDGVEQRARRKFGKLNHYLPALRDAVVEVDVTRERAKEPRERYLLRVLVNGGGFRLRAEERASSMETAIDGAARALTSQARRQKQLYARERAKTAAKPRARAVAPARRGGARGPKVARVKQFAVKPMTVAQAVDEMQLLGHDFFVYHDAETEQVAVLYRRRGGDYGIIMPELP